MPGYDPHTAYALWEEFRNREEIMNGIMGKIPSKRDEGSVQWNLFRDVAGERVEKMERLAERPEYREGLAVARKSLEERVTTFVKTGKVTVESLFGEVTDAARKFELWG
jgi:hypothetical protein